MRATITYAERKRRREANEAKVAAMNDERMPWPEWWFKEGRHNRVPLADIGMPRTDGNRHHGPLPTRS